MWIRNKAIAMAVALLSAGALSDAVAASSLGAKQLPKVSVRWDCGNCTPNDKVAPLIISDYEAQARQKGYAISSAETAEIVITEYRQRPPGARVMLGAFAGKDKLVTKVIFRGKEYKATDSAVTIMSGMNSLCATVAKKVASQLSRAVGG